MTIPLNIRGAVLALAASALCASPALSGAATDTDITRDVAGWRITHAAGEAACHAQIRIAGRDVRLHLAHARDWRADAFVAGADVAAAAGAPLKVLGGEALAGAASAAATGEAGLDMHFEGAEPLSRALLSGGFEFVLADGADLMVPTPNGLAVLSELVSCAEAVRP